MPLPEPVQWAQGTYLGNARPLYLDEFWIPISSSKPRRISYPVLPSDVWKVEDNVRTLVPWLDSGRNHDANNALAKYRSFSHGQGWNERAEMKWFKGGWVTNNEYWSQTYSPKHSREFEFVCDSISCTSLSLVSQTDLASSPYAP